MDAANDRQGMTWVQALTVIVLFLSIGVLGFMVEENETDDEQRDGGIAIGKEFYSADEVRKAREYGYDFVSGKPVDMSNEDWEYLNRRLLSEGMNKKEDRHQSARAIWRHERYIRKQLE